MVLGIGVLLFQWRVSYGLKQAYGEQNATACIDLEQPQQTFCCGSTE